MPQPDDDNYGADETSMLLRKPIAAPSGLRYEARYLLANSPPLMATYLLQYSFFVVTTVVAGRLGPTELAAASIGVTTMNVVGMCIYEGMATSLDMLCAQAYGAGNLHGVGLHVQRMLLLMAVVSVPIGLAWLWSPSLLALALPQKEVHLAVLAGDYLRASLLGLPGYAAFEAGKRLLQAQGDFGTGLWTLVALAPVNALLSWAFAFPLGMGLRGAALASSLTNDLRPVLLLAFATGRKAGGAAGWRSCWGGWSRDALSGWGPMVKQAAAGAITTLGDWGAFELVSFSTSYLGETHLAAQTVLVTLSVILWHIPFSLSVVVSTRIGHLIGAGLVAAAHRASALYAFCFLIVGMVDGLVLFLFRHQLVALISDHASVQELATQAMLAVAMSHVLDAAICGTSGVLRGLGRQGAAATTVTVVNYLGAVPLAVWLELGSPRLGVPGVWIGIGLGMVLIAAVECGYIKLLRWQDCVDDAKSREQ